MLYAETLGFKPIYDAFVNTIKRDSDLSDAQTVLRQLPSWI